MGGFHVNFADFFPPVGVFGVQWMETARNVWRNWCSYIASCRHNPRSGAVLDHKQGVMREWGRGDGHELSV